MEFEQGKWCLSVKKAPAKQINVELEDGKAYDYLCRYPVEEGDTVIIGNRFPSMNDLSFKSSPNTGKLGKVKKVADSITVKKAHAIEVDFVLTKNITKGSIKECVKYIKEDSYEKLFQFEKQYSPIRPISCFIRKYLAAASILANEELADSASIEVAKNCINETLSLDYDMYTDLIWAMGHPFINLSEVYIPGANLEDELRKISGEAFIEYGEVITDWEMYEKLLSNEEVNNFIAKYSYMGAVSIMNRCGLDEMLKAFINEYQNKNKYKKEALEVFKENEKVLSLLK